MDNMNLFSKTHIEKGLLNKEFFNFNILVSTDSTNNEAKKLAEKGLPEGTVILADTQTAGKGRMNRKFSSPSGTGIYMSIILRPKFSAMEALTITTAAAVAVSKAIEKLTAKQTGIKWVNDIYMADRKVCGILIESKIAPDGNSLKYAILGIGINVFAPENGFPDEIKNIAGAVLESNYDNSNFREKLIAETLNEFERIYLTLPNRNYLEHYRSRSVLTGKAVEILKCGEVCGEGTVEGIDDDMNLIIRHDDGTTEKLSSGEVSVKKKV